jgi:hypothetical protein
MGGFLKKWVGKKKNLVSSTERLKVIHNVESNEYRITIETRPTTTRLTLTRSRALAFA